MSKRFILEGTWSGYRASQSRVCHRKVTIRPERYAILKTILYTDGTTLNLSIRPCNPRERVVEIDGYSDLIRDALKPKKSFVTVEELNEPVPA